MKKLIILLLLVTSSISAQNLNAPTVTYISFSPCITNEIGSFATKFSPTIEIGRQFQDMFTLGLAIGKTNFSRSILHSQSDSDDVANKIGDDIYLELRPNLNVFQVGKFVNTFTTGIGYVFGPTPSLMLEFTSGVEYSYSDTIHVNIFYGNYYYSSFDPSPDAPYHFSPTFVGFSIVKFFKPVKVKGIASK